MTPKIFLCQIEVEPGHPDKNLKTILEEIGRAKNAGVDILVFPEMAVSGYLLGDEWENDDLLAELMMMNEQIKEASEKTVVIWGNVYVDYEKKGEDGRVRKYNAVYICKDKKWISNGVFDGRSYKTLMPKYREFDDERYFYSLSKLAQDNRQTLEELLQPFEVEIRGKKIKLGLMLCEDMWDADYSTHPSEVLVKNGAEVLINISCSPWTAMKNDKRHRVVSDIIHKTGVPFYYCNNTGIQNNGKNIFVFDGSSTEYSSNGEIVTQNETFSDVQQAIVYGLKKFFEKLPSKRVVIGLSGGIDSAVSATLLVGALGKENVLAINMPSKFNSSLTKNAAEKLAGTLGIEYKVIPIQESVDWTVKQLETAGLNTNSMIVENIQARDRGSRVLAAVAATVSGVFINNGNKTETALGYATLYGDVGGAISPLGDLYKWQIYELARSINKDKEIIPNEIVEVVPSAELSEKQDVTKGLGDPMNYPYHDRLVRAFVEWRWDPQRILQKYDNLTLDKDLELPERISKYFSSREKFVADLEHKWRLYKTNIFKRVQSPPIIVVSRRAFGFDLREAINGTYFTSEYKKTAQVN